MNSAKNRAKKPLKSRFYECYPLDKIANLVYINN